jgi:hypothetical protein
MKNLFQLRSFNSKAVPTMTKLSHIRLNFRDFDKKLPLIRQNVINRNASSNLNIFQSHRTLEIANPDSVNALYEEFRTKRYDLDILRRRRNEHAVAYLKINGFTWGLG